MPHLFKKNSFHMDEKWVDETEYGKNRKCNDILLKICNILYKDMVVIPKLRVRTSQNTRASAQLQATKTSPLTVAFLSDHVRNSSKHQTPGSFHLQQSKWKGESGPLWRKHLLPITEQGTLGARSPQATLRDSSPCWGQATQQTPSEFSKECPNLEEKPPHHHPR